VTKTFESKPGARPQSLFLVEEEDVYSDLTIKKGTTLFLGRYEESVILEILERNRFFKKVRKKCSVYKWASEEQVYPMCDELKGYFHSRAYKRAVKDTMGRHNYVIDWERFKLKFDEEMASLSS
jgi:hypothetical protein